MTDQIIGKDRRFRAKCKAFAGEGVNLHHISVDSEGTVRVWDSVAENYTTCHALSQSAQARLRRFGVRIDISICPTDLPENNGCGDDHDPDVVLAALRAFVDKVYPEAWKVCLQIGHRQGDGWAAIDGDDDAGAQFMEDFWASYN